MTTATQAKTPRQTSRKPKEEAVKQEPLSVTVAEGDLPGFDAASPHRDKSTESGMRQVGTMSNLDFMRLVGAFDGTTFQGGKLNVEAFQRAPIGFGPRSYKYEMARDMLLGREVPVIIVYRFDGRLFLEDGQQRADTLRKALTIAWKIKTEVKLDASEQSILDAAGKKVADDGGRVIGYDELVTDGRQGLDLRWGLTAGERLAYFDTYNRKGAKVSTRHIVEATATADGWADRFAAYGFDLSTELFEKEHPGAKGKPAKPAEGEEAPASKKGTKLGLLLACAKAYADGDQTVGVKDMDESHARAAVAKGLDNIGDTTVGEDFRWLFENIVPALKDAYPTSWVKENYKNISDAPVSVKQVRGPAELLVVSIMAALGTARADEANNADDIESAKEALLKLVTEEAESDPLNLVSGATALEIYYSDVRGAQGEAHRRFLYAGFVGLFEQGLFRENNPINWKLGDTSKKKMAGATAR